MGNSPSPRPAPTPPPTAPRTCYRTKTISGPVTDVTRALSSVNFADLVVCYNIAPGYTCNNPILRVDVIGGDHDWSGEYMDIKYQRNFIHQSLLTRCSTNRQDCNTRHNCINRQISSSWTSSHQHQIRLHQSRHVHRLSCQYSLDATLTLICQNSNAPTLAPVTTPEICHYTLTINKDGKYSTTIQVPGNRIKRNVCYNISPGYQCKAPYATVHSIGGDYNSGYEYLDVNYIVNKGSPSSLVSCSTDKQECNEQHICLDKFVSQETTQWTPNIEYMIQLKQTKDVHQLSCQYGLNSGVSLSCGNDYAILTCLVNNKVKYQYAMDGVTFTDITFDNPFDTGVGWNNAHTARIYTPKKNSKIRLIADNTDSNAGLLCSVVYKGITHYTSSTVDNWSILSATTGGTNKVDVAPYDKSQWAGVNSAADEHFDGGFWLWNTAGNASPGSITFEYKFNELSESLCKCWNELDNTVNYCTNQCCEVGQIIKSKTTPEFTYAIDKNKLRCIKSKDGIAEIEGIPLNNVQYNNCQEALNDMHSEYCYSLSQKVYNNLEYIYDNTSTFNLGIYGIFLLILFITLFFILKTVVIKCKNLLCCFKNMKHAGKGYKTIALGGTTTSSGVSSANDL